MSQRHEHGVCSNTVESFETFIGCKVKGVLRHKSGYTMVFTCGWGLTITYNGAFWTETPEKVSDEVKELRAELVRAGAR